MLTLNASVLRRLFAINNFVIPNNTGIVFFGIRGSLPVDLTNNDFAPSHRIRPMEINHLNTRCTLGQWKLSDDTIAVFAGSTVPNIKNITKAKAQNGAGANQLLSGFYTDHFKGNHAQGRPSQHAAFRVDVKLPVRRTSNDLVYDDRDPIFVQQVFDNIHAGFCNSIDTGFLTTDDPIMESAGCQVVMGYPPNANFPLRSLGPWGVFKANGYNFDQEKYPYLLLPFRDYLLIADAPSAPRRVRLRWGSEGPNVLSLQNALIQNGSAGITASGKFGERTLNAVVALQRAAYEGEADGIVGPLTASLVGLNLPSV